MTKPEWQRTYQFGMLLIVPPASVCEVIDPLRKLYSPIAQSYFQTHVSVTQPFLHPPTPDVLAEIEAIVSGFRSFSITYGPLRTWSSGRIIFFEIQPADVILELRENLHKTGMFNLSLPFTEGFVPHMTIQEGYAEGTPGVDIVSSAEGLQVYERLKPSVQHGEFVCTGLDYTIPDENFHFTSKRHFAFSD